MHKHLIPYLQTQFRSRDPKSVAIASRYMRLIAEMGAETVDETLTAAGIAPDEWHAMTRKGEMNE